MRFRRTFAAATSGAILTGGLVLPPVASAQLGTVVTRTLAMNHSCSYTGAGGSSPTVSPSQTEVSYPASVKPGEIFTSTVWPGQMRTNGSQVGRFAYAIKLPANVDLIGVRSLGGDYGLNVSAGQVLTVDLVDSNGDPVSAAPNVDGTHVRIAAGMTPAFGGDETTRVTLPAEWGNGLNIPANTNFRLPKVEITLRAPVDRNPTPIAIDLHGGTGGVNNSPNNAFQFSHVGWASLGQRYGFCGRSYPAGSSSLTSTAITTDTPIVATSATVQSGGDRTLVDGQQTSFIATVAVDGASNREMGYGEVIFRRSDTNAELGRSPVNRFTGEAKLDRAFQGTLQGYSFDVSAEYTGVLRGGIRSINGSSSGSVNVTIAPNTIRYGVNITRVTRLPESGGQVPVQISTALSSPNGTFPAGLQAQLYRNGQPVGDPQQASASMSFTDTVQKPAVDTTYHYTVRLSPIVIANWSHSGESVGSAGVIIDGTSPSAPVDLDFIDLPVDPDFIFKPGGSVRALEIGAGSLGSLSPFYYAFS